MVTITDPVIFVPCIDKQEPRNHYYKATISNTDEAIHYIFLYTVGFSIVKEPRRRWILIDLIEYRNSEDREEVTSLVKHTQALDSMHEILAYVGDVYNTQVRFKDIPEKD